MGQSVYLTLGNRGQFEAKNLLPVNWLALLNGSEFATETREVEGERFDVNLYRTTAEDAAARAEAALALVRGKPVSRFFRPLVILRDEVRALRPNDQVEMEVTQFVAVGDQYERTANEAPGRFSSMLSALTGDIARDTQLLQNLVQGLSLYPVPSLAELDAENLMFALLGTWEDAEDDRYGLEDFDEAFWMPFVD